MFMMVGRGVRWAGAALVMFAALAACGRQTAGAAAQSYEIVTQTRPESQEAYMRVYRLAYDACARVRAIQNLPPPPPLVTLPADFVIKRSTYLSNGVITSSGMKNSTWSSTKQTARRPLVRT